MNIIGLHNDEDSGVCLIRNGKLVEAVNEERFNRIKLYKGFPQQSLNYLFDRHGIGINDIDWFAYGWHGRQNDYLEYAQRLTKRVIRALSDNPACGDIINERLQVEISRDTETRSLFESKMEELGIPAGRIRFLDHHLSHSWAAFACSPFSDALIFTFDGRGDLKSTTVSSANAQGILEHDYQLSFDSLGFLYGQVTHFLGFKPHRHEGKVTGLAAYGDPEKALPLFRSLITWDEHSGSMIAQLGPYRPFYTNISPELAAEYGRFTREDLAAGLQRHCEDLVTRYIEHWRQRLGGERSRFLCLAGGVFANVRINQKVAELPGVENIYVFPHMGDGGLSVGAAMQLLHTISGQLHLDMATVRLGPSYSEAEIARALERKSDRIKVARPVDRVGAVVDDLMELRVVGYFDQRMEFGPRALGARSILYPARDRNVNDWLNKRLQRTEFMPFAPVSPEELAKDCYIGWRPDHVSAQMMTRTYNCSPDFADRHAAVVHIDGTARPQIVSQERDGDYYRVVRRYCERSGDSALINTSFNQHEEPIVCSPDHAVGALLRGNLDVLHIGPFRVEAR